MRIPMISLMAAGALALGGCTDMYGYNGLGVGISSGYGGYGGGYGYSPYGSYGYGSPYGSYYGSGYSPYGYGGGYGGYSSPYYGWYNNYYYPGTGNYVYDSYRRPVPMTSTQRTYWSQRSPALRTNTTTKTQTVKPNWSTFERREAARDARQTARTTRRDARKAEQQQRRSQY